MEISNYDNIDINNQLNIILILVTNHVAKLLDKQKSKKSQSTQLNHIVSTEQITTENDSSNLREEPEIDSNK